MDLRLNLIFLVLLILSISSYAQNKRMIKSPTQVKVDNNILNAGCDNKPLPDIELLSVAVSDLSSYSSGAIMTVRISLRNSGQCKTNYFKVRIKRIVDHGNTTTDHEWKYFKVQPLEPYNGHNANKSYTGVEYEFVTHPSDKVRYRFSVDVDPEDYVNEFIENNNSMDRVGEFIFQHSN